MAKTTIIGRVGRGLTWLLLAAIGVEALSFVVVTAGNYILYGGPREGSRVRYDPYALFLHQDGPKVTPQAPASAGPTKVIWLFGGSTMRADSLEPDQTIPAALAVLLNQGPVYYRVFNFGENSFNSLLEVNYLQKLLAEQQDRPDLIVFYDGANECVYLAQHRNVYGHHGYRRLTALVESYHRSVFGLLKPLHAAIAASFTRELYDKIRQTLVPLEKDGALISDYVALAEKRYDHVQWLARAMDSRFLLVLQPLWWTETQNAAPAVQAAEAATARMAGRFAGMRDNFRRVYKALDQRLRAKPYFVNFQNVLTLREVKAYQDDGVHMTAEGNRMVAEQLAAVLRQRGLL